MLIRACKFNKSNMVPVYSRRGSCLAIVLHCQIEGMIQVCFYFKESLLYFCDGTVDLFLWWYRQVRV